MAHEDTAHQPAETGDQDDRSKVEFWRKWIQNAKKAAREHHAASREAWKEYEGRRTQEMSNFIRPFDELRDACPAWWHAVKHLEPAFYARTPKLVARRRFGIKDPVAMTAGLVRERLGEYHVDGTFFDSIMTAAVGDLIHADKATIQLKYDAETEPERIPLMFDGEQYYDSSGGMAPSDAQIMQTTDGQFFYDGSEQVVIEETQRIRLAPCSYDEVLHTPEARCEDEILDKAYKFSIPRAEAVRRFQLSKAEQLQVRWKRQRDDEREEREERREVTVEASDQYIEGWECWCILNKKVYWYSEQYPEMLDMRPDPYGLKGFFPGTPYIIGSRPSKSLFPTPTYIQLFPQIRELHRIAERIPPLIDAARRRALVDADEDLVHALNNLEESEFIATRGMKGVVEKGGLANMIHYVPVQELVASISELSSIADRFKEEFYEFFGLPAILRGVSDPLDAAETNRRMAAAGNDRFRYMKKQIACMARDAIEMMVELALRVYSDRKIMEIVGFEFMSPEDQMRFPAALALLRSDKSSMVRLDIEVDSMSFVDEQVEAQKMEKVSALVTQGFQSIAEMIQINPGLAVVPLNILLMSLEQISPGRAIMDDIRNQIQEMIEDAKQQKENPPPPPPDYEAQKIQLENQKLEIKNQELQLKGFTEQGKLQAKQFENQVKLQKQMADEQIAAVTVQLDAQRLGLEAHALGLEELRVQLDQAMNVVMGQLESHRVAIEQFRAEGEQDERMMEEHRLAKQVDNEFQVGVLEALKPEAPEQPQQQAAAPTIINVNKPSLV